MALIDVEHLSFAYDAVPVLDDVTLSVAPGEKLAILGGNGSGKTTLAQWIAGWLPRGTFKASQGSVTIEGRSWAELDAATRAGAAQFVGQVPMQQLSGFAFTVRDEIAFGAGNLGLPEPEIRERVQTATAMCNLGHLADRDPFSLSGGEQQRLSIAAAMAMRPRALVLDEPTGNFDPESRDALLAQMAKLPEELAIVWCDVTLGAAMAVAERFVLLDAGRIAYDGDAAGLLTHPRTEQIFGLPAVAEAALLLQAQELWPEGTPISADPLKVAQVLRPMLAAAP